MFEMKTDFNGRHYMLEVMEQICIPSCKGDIFGALTFDGDGWGRYDFALSFDERYDENDTGNMKEVFADSPVVKLGEKLMSEKRMKDFHWIVLDTVYREKLLGEIQ